LIFDSAQKPVRILVTGGSGQVGGKLVELLRPLSASGIEVHAPARAELDLANTDSIRRTVRQIQPRWIFNPGAYTAVDKAETDRETAFAINAVAPGVLGEEAARVGAAVIHFSTDYVFPGTGTMPYAEADTAGPLGVYGASKLAGEQALAASGAAHLIFRTSWVYGATGKNFLLTVLRIAAERPEMRIVDDQYGAPTSAAELARLTLHAVRHCESLAAGKPLAGAMRPVSGLYHAAGAGETTWFGFAQEALRQRHQSRPDLFFGRLLPIATSDYPTPARRPPNSRLSCARLLETFYFQFKPWQEALADVIAQLP
jgi:dTDP-4-dehydrorhamnose reductase